MAAKKRTPRRRRKTTPKTNSLINILAAAGGFLVSEALDAMLPGDGITQAAIKAAGGGYLYYTKTGGDLVANAALGVAASGVLDGYQVIAGPKQKGISFQARPRSTASHSVAGVKQNYRQPERNVNIGSRVKIY